MPKKKCRLGGKIRPQKTDLNEGKIGTPIKAKNSGRRQSVSVRKSTRIVTKGTARKMRT